MGMHLYYPQQGCILEWKKNLQSDLAKHCKYGAGRELVLLALPPSEDGKAVDIIPVCSRRNEGTDGGGVGCNRGHVTAKGELT